MSERAGGGRANPCCVAAISHKTRPRTSARDSADESVDDAAPADERESALASSSSSSSSSPPPPPCRARAAARAAAVTLRGVALRPRRAAAAARRRVAPGSSGWNVHDGSHSSAPAVRDDRDSFSGGATNRKDDEASRRDTQGGTPRASVAESAHGWLRLRAAACARRPPCVVGRSACARCLGAAVSGRGAGERRAEEACLLVCRSRNAPSLSSSNQ